MANAASSRPMRETSPLEELRSQLYHLADALAAAPPPERASLREPARRAHELYVSARLEDGLLSLLLRNLLTDLAARKGIDNGYYARQLSLAVDRLPR